VVYVTIYLRGGPICHDYVIDLANHDRFPAEQTQEDEAEPEVNHWEAAPADD
jgi:hypothetical protein